MSLNVNWWILKYNWLEKIFVDYLISLIVMYNIMLLYINCIDLVIMQYNNYNM